MEKTSWSIKCGKFKFGGSLAGGRLGKAWTDLIRRDLEVVK